MDRTQIIQQILDKKSSPTYLEIGVANGENFFPIRARRKIAVDPNFVFSRGRRMEWALRNPRNIVAKYHRLESDSYFADPRHACPLDVVFIDGLHTYQQSLRDVHNSLENLRERGAIVVHDCNPPHAAAAYPAASLEEAVSLNPPGWTGPWCGDVWKTICFLRSKRMDLRVFVLDCDLGLGIITRGVAESPLELAVDEVDKMTYDEFSRDRKRLLNLKDEDFIHEFLGSI